MNNNHNETPNNLPVNKNVEGNPLGDAFNVMISIPEKVEIKMVDATSLADYEIWIFISTILSSAMIGFWVAYFQNSNPDTAGILYWNSIVLSILFVTTLIVSLSKRYKMNKRSKTINLKTSQHEVSSGG